MTLLYKALGVTLLEDSLGVTLLACPPCEKLFLSHSCAALATPECGQSTTPATKIKNITTKTTLKFANVCSAMSSAYPQTQACPIHLYSRRHSLTQTYVRARSHARASSAHRQERAQAHAPWHFSEVVEDAEKKRLAIKAPAFPRVLFKLVLMFTRRDNCLGRNMFVKGSTESSSFGSRQYVGSSA